MIVIITLSSKRPSFPVEALSVIDSALAAAGLKRQVRSVLAPGKEFAVTYDGPTTDKGKVIEIIRPIAERYVIEFSVEVEESVSFP